MPDLRRVLTDQQAEARELGESAYVHRYMRAEIESSLQDRLVKVITGSRRSGKSHIAHQVLKSYKYGYVNFDDERLHKIASDDLNECLEILLSLIPGAEYLLFDEIQNIAGWELFVNRLQRSGYRVIITGSNAHLLSRELATHLTGRYRLFELYPFSFTEFLEYRKVTVKENVSTKERAQLTRLFDDYMKLGGFPEVGQVRDHRQYFQDLFNSIIARDVAVRHHVKKIRTLKELAKLMMVQCGSKISYQKISKAFGIASIHTVQNYISYLADAYMIFELQAFSFKFREQVKTNRKIYCIDHAFARANSIAFSENSGHMLENIVFIELKRRKKNIFYFYDTVRSHEVDFVIQKGTKVDALIQVCLDLANIETKEREVRALLNASEKLKCKNLLIICRDEEKEEVHSNIKIRYVPVWQWMLDTVADMA